MADIFETATRRKLRFTAPVGRIGVEDLWDLPLVSGSKATRDVKMDLDTISQTALAELSKFSNAVSLVSPTPTQGRDEAELRVEVLKHIIDVKKEEAKQARDKAARSAEAARLREALANKQDAAIAVMSEEEIRKRLDELQGE